LDACSSLHPSFDLQIKSSKKFTVGQKLNNSLSKLPALKREHPTFQKTIYFFIFCGFSLLFAHLDPEPDPDPHSQFSSESGLSQTKSIRILRRIHNTAAN
jgi:hypothetical protein